MSAALILFAIAIAVCSVDEGEGFQTACPTWSSWSDYTDCPRDSNKCPTLIVAVTQKTFTIAENIIRSKIIDFVENKLDFAEKGRDGSLRYEVRNFRVSSFNPPVVRIVRSENKLEFSVKGCYIKVKFDAKCSYKVLKQRIRKTFHIEIKFKLKSLSPTFGLDVQNDVPQLKFLNCETDVSVDMKERSWPINALFQLFGLNGQAEKTIKKTIIQTFCATAENFVLAKLNTQVSRVTLQSSIDNKFGMAFPVKKFVTNKNNVHLQFLAWLQSEQLWQVSNLGKIAEERQAAAKVKHQRMYMCHDERFMAHIGFSDYFFNDFLHDAWKNELFQYSSKLVANDKDFSRIFKMSCEAGHFCVGQALGDLKYAYKYGVVMVKVHMMQAPYVQFKDGGISLHADAVNATFVIADKWLEVPLFDLGSLKIQISLAAYPYIKNGVLFVRAGLTRFNFKIKQRALSDQLPDNRIIDAGLERLVTPLVMRRLDELFEKGIPIPQLDKSKIGNLSITMVDYNVLQVSADYAFDF